MIDSSAKFCLFPAMSMVVGLAELKQVIEMMRRSFLKYEIEESSLAWEFGSLGLRLKDVELGNERVQWLLLRASR